MNNDQPTQLYHGPTDGSTIADMLAAIGTADVDRGFWLTIGMAVHDELPNAEGFELWDQWSRTAPNRYQQRAAHDAWESFQPGHGVTIATLVKHATDAGYKSPAASRRNGARRRNDEQSWKIMDSDGKLVAVHVRIDLEDGKKVFWRGPNGQSGLGGVKTRDLPLYGSELLRKSGGPIVITEGEKAALALRRATDDVLALGTVTGASGTPSTKVLAPVVEYCRQRRKGVYLWPDNDEPGRQHMKNVAGALLDAGCRDPLVIEWQDAQPADDAADWLGRGSQPRLQQLLTEAQPAISDSGPLVFPEKDEDALETALTQLGVKVRYNVRAARTEVLEAGTETWQQMNDRITSDLRRTIAANYSYETERGPRPLRYGRETWADYLNALLRHREVDPVVEWLDGLPEWDQEPRVDDLLRVAFEIDEQRTPIELERWASRYLTLGSVWRSYHPGVKQDEMPVIIGPQQRGKSTLLSHLLPEEHRDDWFSDGLNLADEPQRRAEALQGRLIVEAGEMAGSSRADLESLKAFLTRQNDGNVRLAYRKDPETMLRRCIIVGSANGASLPNDPTGNRRFVAIHVKEGGDVGRLRSYLDEHRDQLWAEAVHLYRTGTVAWLPPGLHELQSKVNDLARRRDDILEDSLDTWLLTAPGDFTMAEAAIGCGLAANDYEVTKVPRRDELRLGAALRLRGYEKVRERSQGGRKVVWRATS